MHQSAPGGYFQRSRSLAFHVFNKLQALFSQTDYFRDDTNCVVRIKKGDFSNGHVYGGYYRKLFSNQLSRCLLKIYNWQAICNVLDSTPRVLVEIIHKYALAGKRLDKFNECSTSICNGNEPFRIGRFTVISSLNFS